MPQVVTWRTTSGNACAMEENFGSPDLRAVHVSIDRTCAGGLEASKHICKNLTGVFQAAAECVLATPAGDTAACAARKSNAAEAAHHCAHEPGSASHTQHSLAAPQIHCTDRRMPPAVTGAAPLPICAPFSGGAPVAFSTSRQPKSSQPIVTRQGAGRIELGAAPRPSNEPVPGSLVLQVDIDFFHNLNCENDTLHTQWVTESKARREGAVAAVVRPLAPISANAL